MKKQLLIISALLSVGGLNTPAYSGWQDWVKEADKVLQSTTGQDSRSTVTSALSNDEITQGLKEALDVGVKKAIDTLGTKNGFLNDQSVRIPLPDSMQQVEKALRSFGQEEMADEFVTSMNRAAEKAVPQVTNVFVDAISKMSLDDAQGILSGGDTAATDYFKTHTSEQLGQLISPYVNDAMNEAQVTQYYKSMASQVKKYDSFGLMDSYLGSAADIDRYVTDKTMEGLFTKIAAQEKLIRQNPAARSTEILKDVFGSISR
ncbi:MAG: DUF4197 domain-containing protein [gamma proteobacterium symbiont of Bathyaustriella thionipta]|nr:DUF4197 domain-containing protein [gamma proteobacterium symbiont of Bathyaustriella thionipta]MCU7950854.1 DUF4197 domain-containing protein [gamma proteobacterium symbiont of Bathyaustriella thionipta]MCU7952749.1 DUF4197 domain-containing protein [gamma proteobacterium symbiont of Bathyaustriella thionipta]MCU7957468.1 DUF4197 domain-containing protein [gamma proteobacterium symbiont of Bathyaustriella thionipta]MCU7968691.1 DUF4197 domain-containing protein [gamma proteobacterium symbion